MTPDDDNVSPAGNEPELTFQLYGGTPPDSPDTVWSAAT